MKAGSVAQRSACGDGRKSSRRFHCATGQDLTQKGSLNTATLRQGLQNHLGANSLLDLVVFGRQAAETTVRFCTDAVVTLNVINPVSCDVRRGDVNKLAVARLWAITPGRALSWKAEGGAVNQMPPSSATLALFFALAPSR